MLLTTSITASLHSPKGKGQYPIKRHITSFFYFWSLQSTKFGLELDKHKVRRQSLSSQSITRRSTLHCCSTGASRLPKFIPIDVDPADLPYTDLPSYQPSSVPRLACFLVRLWMLSQRFTLSIEIQHITCARELPSYQDTSRSPSRDIYRLSHDLSLVYIAFIQPITADTYNLKPVLSPFKKRLISKQAHHRTQPGYFTLQGISYLNTDPWCCRNPSFPSGK